MPNRPSHGALSESLTPHLLFRARKKLRLTQAQLAQILGLTPTQIYAKESDASAKHHRPVLRAQALAIECLLRREEQWNDDWLPDVPT